MILFFIVHSGSQHASFAVVVVATNITTVSAHMRMRKEQKTTKKKNEIKWNILNELLLSSRQKIYVFFFLHYFVFPLVKAQWNSHLWWQRPIKCTSSYFLYLLFIADANCFNWIFECIFTLMIVMWWWWWRTQHGKWPNKKVHIRLNHHQQQ